MNHFSFELSLLAVLPALALCGYVFYKDRIEKEPVGLLALLFGAGAVAYIPTFFAQSFVADIIDGFFENKISFSPEGAVTYISAGAETAHAVACAFGAFSVVQIVVKWCILYFVTHKNKNFNYLFDGIVYSVFISLGFAVAENVHFLINNDVQLMAAKLLASVPCHLFVGIIMGAYYTMWHVRYLANGIEEDMLEAGIIEKDRILTSVPWLTVSLVLPIAVNGLYILAGTVNDRIITVIFYTCVFLLYGISFIVINFMASKDGKNSRYLCRIILQGHPELPVETVEKIVKDGASSLTKGGDAE